MKYLDEYRDANVVKSLVESIYLETRHPWTLMEVCGGQTHSLVKNGIIDMLPKDITLVHGPGCPVCVTPIPLIDEIIEISMNPGTIVCSFGDMVRVPGSRGSLLKAKALGADLRMVYSPVEAVKIAEENPGKEVVFFAVGFETTTPANALAVLQAEAKNLQNFSLLVSQVRVPPAMEVILNDPESLIQGFLAAGHVCTVMGSEEYNPIVTRYKVPIVITGFEPVDLLTGILAAVRQLEKGIARVENQYRRVVNPEGNIAAREMIDKVFEISGRGMEGNWFYPGQRI